MSNFSKARPTAWLFASALLFGSCALSYQNYHRANVKTPVQCYQISPVEAEQAPQKGDLGVSVNLTRSGKNHEDPQKNFWDEPGQANLTRFRSLGGSASYALDDHWLMRLRGNRAEGERTIKLESFEQRTPDSLLLLTLLTLGLSSYFTPPVSLGSVGEVQRRYDSWDLSLGAGFHPQGNDGRCSFDFGLTLGGAKLVGTTHAMDTRIYPAADVDAPPATYGRHRSRFVGLFFQPKLLLSNPKEQFARIGLSSGLNFYRNALTSEVHGFRYSEVLHHLLAQPAIFAAIGPKNLGLTFSYSRLVPLLNKSKEHFNKNYLHVGLRAIISRKGRAASN